MQTLLRFRVKEKRMDLSRITQLSFRYQEQKTRKNQQLPGLSVFHRDAPSNIEASVYEPVLCLVLQGSKIVTIGDHTVDLSPGKAVLVCHDIPVVSRITRASTRAPYVALILSLDPQLVRSLHGQIAELPRPDVTVKPLSVGAAEPTWVAPLVRYLELMNSSLDAKVLGPSILREIHYRLLLSPIGQGLRNLLVLDSQASRIAKAIQRLRSEYRSTLKVSELAKVAAMSASSFHEHFKNVTGTTPLQYQKDLRLIEARILLMQKSSTVSDVAFAVGYESPTHFSRDYSRKFGLAPSKDVTSQ
jgi:AraC-like DNA-binding protein